VISLKDDCTLCRLSSSSPISDFVCNNADLNEFFAKDAIKYQEELLGETFFFRLKKNSEVVCAFTMSNDSIRTDDLPNSRKKKVKEHIPHAKGMKSYPATLIGRLGVAKKFEGKGVGRQLMNFIKGMCLIEDGNRCRFLLIDAYNNENTIIYYSKNEFQFVFSTEQQEKDYYELTSEKELKTRFMFFDLKLWAVKSGLL
jgi:GNAT superfamily N-acetyltransferase